MKPEQEQDYILQRGANFDFFINFPGSFALFWSLVFLPSEWLTTYLGSGRRLVKGFASRSCDPAKA